MINLLVKLSESDKRVLICLVLVFILLLVLIGYLVKLIKYIFKKQGEFVDKTMYDLVKTNIVSDKKQFIKISKEKNRRKFYFEARIPVFVSLLSLILVLIYHISVRNFSWEFMGHYLYDASFTLSWPTTTLFGIPVISNWPTIAKASVFHFNEFGAWVSYIFFIANVYAIIHYLICVCAFMSRNIASKKRADLFFKKDLGDLKKAKDIAETVSLKEPSQEIKDYVNKGETKS